MKSKPAASFSPLLLFCRAFLLISGVIICSACSNNQTRRNLAENYVEETMMTLPMADFGNTKKVALHFPCKESNMFATNCACHLKCIGGDCQNAVDLCEKYEKSHGCKYVLLRGGAKKIATLKRVPTVDELKRIRIDEFKSYRPPHRGHRSPSLKELITNSSSIAMPALKQIAAAKLDSAKGPSKYCPQRDTSLVLNDFVNQLGQTTIALVVISYHGSLTLANSVRSWEAAGLLDMVSERIAILSDPTEEDINLATWFDFKIIQPKSVRGAKMTKDNVFTIGAAFFYALKAIRSDHILFMENDFKADTSLRKETIMAELVAGVGMLARGAVIVRLMSRTQQGCGTFKDCDHTGYHLRAEDSGARVRNWMAFYCIGKKGTEDYVEDCVHTDEIRYRCFTSWDSNWSLNAALLNKAAMLEKKYPSSKGHMPLGEIGLSHWQFQDGFERDMIQSSKWMEWKVPICISYNGVFIHEEIETGA